MTLRVPFRFLALLALLAFPSALAAQATTTQAATATVTISDILTISITNPNISFGTVTSTGYTAGNLPSYVYVSSNVSFTLRIAADASFFDAVQSANDNLISASRLEFNPGGSWFSLSTTQRNLLTSWPAGGWSVTVNYRMLVNATDPKDTYTIGFTYSVVPE